jgi:hypothetical protein
MFKGMGKGTGWMAIVDLHLKWPVFDLLCFSLANFYDADFFIRRS